MERKYFEFHIITPNQMIKNLKLNVGYPQGYSSKTLINIKIAIDLINKLLLLKYPLIPETINNIT